jgi:pyrophosphatase PpaX
MTRRVFDLIVFDMDGTLVDSMDCLADWIYRAVKEHCPPTVTPASITAAFGPTEKAIISKFVPAELVGTCLQTYYDLYEQEHERMYVYPGIQPLINRMWCNKVPIALCTGKSRRAVDISLDLLQWDDVFKAIVTGDDTKEFKPDPEGLNLILQQTAADRSRTIFVGDSPADIRAASNAGVISGYAMWGLAEIPPISEGLAPNHRLLAPQDLSALLFGDTI